jgi:CBS domain-containing protein
MATARELMSQGVECVSSTETLVEAARKMRDLDVGALPICG